MAHEGGRGVPGKGGGEAERGGGGVERRQGGREIGGRGSAAGQARLRGPPA